MVCIPYPKQAAIFLRDFLAKNLMFLIATTVFLSMITLKRYRTGSIVRVTVEVNGGASAAKGIIYAI